LSHISSPFLSWYGVSWNICLGLPQTMILPILASQIARITGMSHWCPELQECFWSKK
jgi:hypothetical protein